MGRIKRFTTAVRDNWERIAKGAVLAGGIAVCFIIVMFVILEATLSQYSDYEMAQFELALILFSLPAGALIGYATRKPKKVSQ